MSACATTLIIIATILGPVTLVFMAVSFGTDHWLEFRVNTAMFTDDDVKQKIKTNIAFARYHISRDRGLFRECYNGNETDFLDNAPDKVDGNCFNINYDQPSTPANPSGDFMSRLHLNRSFLAFFIISIVVFVLAYIFGLILCCLRISKWAYTAGMCAYISAFFLAAAIAFFHGAEYIERNKLDGPGEDEFYPRWPLYLKNATSRNYGWSYALGWVGMILASISATLYSIAGCYLTSELYEDREILDKHRPRDYPIAMEPVYAIGADPYYTKHYGYPRAYLGPMAPEYYARAYPTIGYGDPKSDIWHWREIES